ncbi:hypothetical protein OPW41_04495 [Vibrio europaeus]|uniref:Uncharacterized protein n=1 Tax=Vibrio europaeus TaxID=300876 RepID=A0A178J930_9VIBR|nr:hypothetical protein [Vibrio europaeus]MDC5705125.1 hypothetical protein [Vibrio europaeus]MDC5710404.1 hypothetical protein [Vibrio europaeus]MDC5715494.1 hypothetical protein [Vibrio europaeus]MDC5719655.1 hypothetical protein [Vibrio europaeus]MDC5724457.1 hypothetical protein [Vibrio europaeus]
MLAVTHLDDHRLKTVRAKAERFSGIWGIPLTILQGKNGLKLVDGSLRDLSGGEIDVAAMDKLLEGMATGVRLYLISRR